MNILFILEDVHPSKRMRGIGRFSFAISSLVASLRSIGENPAVLHLICKSDYKTVIPTVTKMKPELVLFTSYSFNFHLIVSIINEIRLVHKCIVAIGGVQATLEPLKTLQDSGADYVFIGEADETLNVFVSCLSNNRPLKSISGLVTLVNGEMHLSKVVTPIYNLNDLPFVSRDIYDNSRVLDYVNRSIPIMASRGCPYTCSYCCNLTLRKISNLQQGCRVRTVENIIKELEVIRKRSGNWDSVIFYDDVFPLDTDWLNVFCTEYPKHVGLPFAIQTRIDLLEPEKADMIVNAGCREISVGIETGNDALRKKILKKNISNQNIISRATQLRHKGIYLGTYNMVGIPGESLPNVYETIMLNSQIESIGTHVSIYQPLPGTELREYCVKHGIVAATQYPTDFYSNSILSFPEASREEIRYSKAVFEDMLSILTMINKLPSPLNKYFNFLVKIIFLAGRNFILRPIIRIFINVCGVLFDWKRYLGLTMITISKRRGFMWKKPLFSAPNNNPNRRTGEI